MLFYNHKQEFIGINDEGLKLLNYASLEELLSVCSDAADLFANEPGYVHNFKNFGWIDFLLHADSDAKSAIVHGKGRTFSCDLVVHTLYLTDTPSQNGYIIELAHIQSISGDEYKPQSAAVQAKPVYEAPAKPIPQPSIRPEPAVSIIPEHEAIEPTPLSEPSTFDIPDYAETAVEYAAEPAPFEIPTFPSHELPAAELRIEEPYAQPEPVQPAPVAPKAAGTALYTPAEQLFIDDLKTDRSYRFDPSIAANELGLPVDLIQEFIGDFIQQSYDFKSDLFEAILKGDMSNLKILSHKLKGVAANLRIEDAFESLSIINTSNDPVEIEANLKHFYQIIDKLEGKESSDFEAVGTAGTPGIVDKSAAVQAPNPTPAPQTAADDDIYEFILKDRTEESMAASSDAADFGAIDLEDIFPEPALTEPDFQPSSPETKEGTVAKLNYDKSSVAGALGIAPEFLEELINDYKQDALTAAKQISDAVAAFDTHQWKQTASQLKGITDHLRLNEIADELVILAETHDAQEAHKASKRLNGFLEQL